MVVVRSACAPAFTPQKVARLQSTLHLVDADVDAATAAPKHIVFVEDGDAARQFDAAKHFDTVPELVDRPANRLRRRQLQDAPIATAPMDVEVGLWLRPLAAPRGPG